MPLLHFTGKIIINRRQLMLLHTYLNLITIQHSLLKLVTLPTRSSLTQAFYLFLARRIIICSPGLSILLSTTFCSQISPNLSRNILQQRM